MPTRAPRPCLHPGCPAMASEGSPYCQAHVRPKTSGADYDRTRRKDDPALSLAASIRSSARWQRLRAYHRRLAPLCVLCSHPATQTHHVEAIGARPDLAFRLENLAALCSRCHARVERMERSGQPTRHLFAGKAIAPRHRFGDAPEGEEGGKSLAVTTPTPTRLPKLFSPQF
jgi:5-methylcytosine-specific restriction protein A